ncbi:ubiquitin-protein ligase E3B-like [Oscarella lobularis]|uniref:ubiquitin-protein ligase E3B-like n=1 Tax=Oscarella lobularis TaxID=121494 RepID=UPI003313CD6E
MSASSAKVWYASLALSKQHLKAWIYHMQTILVLCMKLLRKGNASKPFALFRVLTEFTDCSCWRMLTAKGGSAVRPIVSQLCASFLQYAVQNGLYQMLQEVYFSQMLTKRLISYNDFFTLAWRPVAVLSSEEMVVLFIQYIFSLPGLLSSIDKKHFTTLTLSSEFLKGLEKIIVKCSIMAGDTDVNWTLSVAGNLIELAVLCSENRLLDNQIFFADCLSNCLNRVKLFLAKKESSLSHWHPIVGLVRDKQDDRYIKRMGAVSKQLHMLGRSSVIGSLFSVIIDRSPTPEQASSGGKPPDGTKGFVSFLKRRLNVVFKFSSLSSSSADSAFRLNSSEWKRLHAVCRLYELAMSALFECKTDLLSALSFHEKLLQQLWHSLQFLGRGTASIIDAVVKLNNPMHESLSLLLVLFCHCCYQLVAILDDVEIYEYEKPFTLKDLASLSGFLNQLVFRLIWDVPRLLDSTGECLELRVLEAVHTLLKVLYEKSSRRSFSSQDVWTIRDPKPSAIVSELKSGKPRAKMITEKIPHVIPRMMRVNMLRDLIEGDKCALGLVETRSSAPTSTYVRIRRARFLEDAYEQLCQLLPERLKGTIRVKFINPHGLDEAGIDQEGVFKEFLEETIKKAFDPSLDLFKATSDETLYPSPTSVAQGNFGALFNFMGRMLGKAVYEGILVDVPFADFFLVHLKGTTYSAAYSPFDELSSFDQDLYRNLNYVKHYDDDIADLDLTFSLNEDFFGKLLTHDLVPGGSAIPVTNENKMSYIHRVAHFRMHTQLRKQTAEFVRGFHSIINPEWLGLFSPREIQKLISGDNVELDVEDLKKHVQYFGGFHPAHKVVRWLWDTVANDFNSKEKALFLKFVTSCSKPPILGFSYLQPPFAVRCVQVEDDRDEGDTVGRVIRGFFRQSRRGFADRLPTASTCFNLLKLPNYRSKSILQEKLRFAISSGAGFELS